ncbi:MAG: hypothetical protein WD960_07440 [Gemmatimonadota bacterium]
MIMARCRPGALTLFFGALGLLVGVGAPQGASAQSLFSGGGLGMPADPVEARSRAMGGVQVGLPGWQISMVDPASAAGLLLPSITATVQPSTIQPAGELSGGGSRFPLVGVSYPFGRHVISLQLGSFLDQEWEVRSERSIPLGEGTVSAVDVLSSLGSVGQVRMGWAFPMTQDLAVGANIGTYIGSVEKRFRRDLDAAGLDVGVEPFFSSTRWRASGPMASAGVVWNPSALFRLAGAVEWSGDLEMDPQNEDGSERSYPMAMTVRGGGTFTLAPDLLLTLGASAADWSETAAALDDGGARDRAFSYGGGIEWTRATLRGRSMPVRVGYGSRQLPFHFRGEAVDESSFAAGFGLNLASSETIPTARIDVTVERGSRTAVSLTEEFWRGAISIRLAGN